LWPFVAAERSVVGLIALLHLHGLLCLFRLHLVRLGSSAAEQIIFHYAHLKMKVIDN